MTELAQTDMTPDDWIANCLDVILRVREMVCNADAYWIDPGQFHDSWPTSWALPKISLPHQHTSNWVQEIELSFLGLRKLKSQYFHSWLEASLHIAISLSIVNKHHNASLWCKINLRGFNHKVKMNICWVKKTIKHSSTIPLNKKAAMSLKTRIQLIAAPIIYLPTSLQTPSLPFLHNPTSPR